MTDHYVDVTAYVAERNKALESLDMDYARRTLPSVPDEVLIITLHKTRYEATGVAPELRHASRAWLEEQNYGRFANLPWSTDGSLPA